MSFDDRHARPGITLHRNLSARRTAEARPDASEWRDFAMGTCAFLAIAALCLFIVARLGA